KKGNVLPISVRKAIDHLKHPLPPDGSGVSEWGERHSDWGPLAWREFGEALHTVIHLPQLKPPAPRYVVKAARAGKTPGLSAAGLRQVIALLTHYADALAEVQP